MIATLRRLVLVSAGVFALSACEPAQVRIGVSEALSQADSAYAREDYSEAVRLYGVAAELGDASAQFKLGSLCDPPRSPRLLCVSDWELFWYRLAADQGLALAQNGLGVLYYSGLRGVPQNNAEALRWWRLAADQGLPEAQVNVGDMFWGREGVPQDRSEAIRWYRKAADQGSSVAQYYLGYIYRRGESVPTNAVEAVRWYRLAADQGLALAQVDLGLMYANGEGVPENYVEAFMWFNLAAAQGDRIAIENRDAIRSSMTPEQIAEGQKLSLEWKPR